MLVVCTRIYVKNNEEEFDRNKEQEQVKYLN